MSKTKVAWRSGRMVVSSIDSTVGPPHCPNCNAPLGPDGWAVKGGKTECCKRPSARLERRRKKGTK